MPGAAPIYETGARHRLAEPKCASSARSGRPTPAPRRAASPGFAPPASPGCAADREPSAPQRSRCIENRAPDRDGEGPSAAPGRWNLFLLPASRSTPYDTDHSDLVDTELAALRRLPPPGPPSISNEVGPGVGLAGRDPGQPREVAGQHLAHHAEIVTGVSLVERMLNLRYCDFRALPGPATIMPPTALVPMDVAVVVDLDSLRRAVESERFGEPFSRRHGWRSAMRRASASRALRGLLDAQPRLRRAGAGVDLALRAALSASARSLSGLVAQRRIGCAGGFVVGELAEEGLEDLAGSAPTRPEIGQVAPSS